MEAYKRVDAYRFRTCYNSFVMSNTVAIDTRTARDILTSLKEIKEELGLLRMVLTRPRYGSDEWWEEEIRTGEEDEN